MTLPKYIARKFQFEDEEPMMLCFKEKHGNRVFLIETEEDVKRAMWQVFKDRKKEGWYGTPKDHQKEIDEYEKELVGLKQAYEALKDLPSSHASNHAIEINSQIENTSKRMLVEKDEKMRLEAVFNAKSPCDEVVVFMFSRFGNEYEEIEVEYFEKYEV